MDSVTDGDRARFLSLLYMYDLVQHVKCPTHCSGHCLDLVITRSNQELLLSKPSAGYMISDHVFIHFELNIPQPPLDGIYC